MKLNLGCGSDIISGYRNIDLAGGIGVEKGDIRDLDSLGIQKGTVEEIRAINVIEFIPNQFMRHILNGWVSKLQTGGSIYIISHDVAILCNMIAYGQRSVEDVVSTILGDPNMPHAGGTSLAECSDMLKQLGLRIDSCGLQEFNFFIRATK